MVKKSDADKTKIISGAAIQFTALVILVLIVWIDTKDPASDFQQIELLLVGIAAAAPASALIKQARRDK